MHHDFEDITSRISEPPTWWDSNGTPRYGEFKPDACPNIYADEVILLLIRCQSCHTESKVEMHSDLLDRSNAYQRAKLSKMGDLTPEEAQKIIDECTLKADIENKIIHYGDPPFHSHCSMGLSMNCEDIKVLEYWHKGKDTNYNWARDTSLEITLPDSVE